MRLDWNDEQIDLLKKLHPLMTYQQIADEFRSRGWIVSRMSVKIKGRRLRLPEKTSSPTGAPGKARGAARHGTTARTPKGVQRDPVVLRACVDAPPSLRLTLLEVQDGQCRHMEDDTCCGHPTRPKRRYCDPHESHVRKPATQPG